MPQEPAGTTASSTARVYGSRLIKYKCADIRIGDHCCVLGRLPIVVVLLGLAAGCGSASNHAATHAPSVPWTAAKPPQVAERTPAPTPCRAGALEVQGQVRFVARFQGGIALASLRNTSASTCRLTGRPRVTFVMHGGPQQVQRAIPITPANFPETTYPASSLLALRPGESAAVTITWDNWCDPATGAARVPPSALRITLPGNRGSLDADYNAVPRCIDPALPSTIGVSVFQSSLIRPGRPWSDAFLRASVPDQPVHARRGGILRFRVVLTNASHTAARFDRCPAYVQQLVPSGEVEVYALNCAAAHPIAPGKSLAFSMQVRVPKNAPLGRNGLFWELDPFGARAPQLHARVSIDG